MGELKSKYSNEDISQYILNHEIEIKPKTWIYWKWRDDSHKTYSKSWVQDIIETQCGDLLEITDTESWSKYPTRILKVDINIILSNNAS